MNTVYKRSYAPLKINKREILRYIGAREESESLSKLIDECLYEIEGKLCYNVCYAEFPVNIGDRVDLGFMSVDSKDLKKNLIGCESVIAFAATVGLEIDRIVARNAVFSQTKALIFDGIGAERIESLCDAFNDDMKAEKAREGYSLCPRFSAGYGDFPISAQRDIFAVLDCQRKIGLSLSDSLLMTPKKSVTAIIGVKRTLL